MSYKTFEDMKHEIPEGATHYHNETAMDYFAWVKYEGGNTMCAMPDSKYFSSWHVRNFKDVDQIPQTETPEEKEAFDSMAQSDINNIHKPHWAKWSIGDEVTKVKGSSWTGKVVGYYSTSLTSKGYAVESLTEKGSVQIYPEAALSNIETPQQREERERLEAAYDLYAAGNEHCGFDSAKSFDGFKNDGFQLDFWLTIVDKTGYRKAK